jgi:hypothetical protein
MLAWYWPQLPETYLHERPVMAILRSCEQQEQQCALLAQKAAAKPEPEIDARAERCDSFGGVV